MLLPKISVITPNFNQGDTLEKTILSVLEQEYSPLEYCIYDGGSTDNSVEVIQRYAEKLTYWQSCRDGGQSAAIGEGFARSTGEIMCWLNADDRFAPSTLHRVAEFFMRNPDTQWVAGLGMYESHGKTIETFPVSTNNSVPSRLDFNWFCGWPYNAVLQPSVFWRRSLWEKAGGLNPDLHCVMDLDLWLRFARESPAEVVAVHFSVALWHGKNKSLVDADRAIIEAALLMARNGRERDAERILKPYVRFAFRMRNMILPWCPKWLYRFLKKKALSQ